MPCRVVQDPDTSLSFPPTFSHDTGAFLRAMAEHNWRRQVAGLPEISFLDLERAEQSLVLARAEAIKSGPPAAPIAKPESSEPLWARFLLALDRGLDRISAWLWDHTGPVD